MCFLKTACGRDYYYDSYYASTVGFSTGSAVSATHLVVPSVKRQRLSSSSSRAMKNGTKVNGNNNNGTNYVIPHIPENSLKVYSNPDILICGNCREMFTDLKEIINHKKTYCKLRFTCRCHTIDARDSNDKVTNGSDTSLLCSQCKDPFPNAWDLMVHIQATHMINIYELGVYSDDKEDSSGRSNTSSPINSQHEKMNEELQSNDNDRQNGNCKQNGDSTNDSVMNEIFSNNGQNGNGLLLNDDIILDRSNHLPNATIIADSQTLSSVLLTNGKK